MRTARALMGIVLLGGAAWIGNAPAAEAHDYWGGVRGARWRSPCDSRSRYVRNPCHPSTRILVPRRLGGYGFGGYGFGGYGFGGHGRFG